jgi:hypothetical protein
MWQYDTDGSPDVCSVASVQWAGWDPALLVAWLEKVLQSVDQLLRMPTMGPSESDRIRKFRQEVYGTWKQWHAMVRRLYQRYQCLDVPSVSVSSTLPSLDRLANAMLFSNE